jgi:hypothetical protein
VAAGALLRIRLTGNEVVDTGTLWIWRMGWQAVAVDVILRIPLMGCEAAAAEALQWIELVG